uniref:Uncharacterized protein n=1 Tax=Tanacetum cinerariifolium TaxID=118510 RepID=A0A6L2MAW3_TANCI|nr:hypothetical protein [Tanacetum cinerariifolium]
MYKLDAITLAPKDKNNRETHIYYLKYAMEQAAILKEIFEQAKSLNPLDNASYSAYKYFKLIQELLGYVRDTCPDIHKPSKKLVVVMPINKKKTIMFVKPVIASSTSQKQLGSSQIKTKQTTNNSVSNSTGSVKKAKSKKNGNLQEKITTANKVPLREPIPLEVVAQESVVTKVYTRRPKVPKTNGSIRKPKIAKSVISNKTKSGTSWGSNTSVALSSSSVDLKLSKLLCGIWTLDAQST